MASYLVNCSILFTELPLPERPAAARAAGFDAVEFWWPFDRPVPTNQEMADFVAAVRDAGVRLAGLNFPAGDMPAGDRGLVSWPGRAEEFRAGVDCAVSIGEQLGVQVFNALYGNRLDGVDPAEQDALAVDNLAFAAGAAARIGATVLVEPVSGAPRYPLLTAADALTAVGRVPADNVRLLADLYHLSVNGDDVDAVIARYAGQIGHVQVADAPGRHQPGTGRLPIARWLAALDQAGYAGWVGLEYVPKGTSAASLDWLPRAERVAKEISA
jgi:hydroxypyruvate isomerase